MTDPDCRSGSVTAESWRAHARLLLPGRRASNRTGRPLSKFRATRVMLATALLLAVPKNAQPWASKGHRTVAEIASRHLTGRASAAVADILGRGGARLARAADWPDEVRDDPTWADIQPWHFLNVEDTSDLTSLVRPVATIDSVANVAQAIEFFSDLLSGDAGKRRQLVEFMRERGAEPYLGSPDATALALLVHFIGDVHQPLHVGRESDAGGNRVPVTWFGVTTNLHAVWDEDMIEQEDLSFTELATFIDDADDETMSRWQDDPLSVWARESRDLATEIYAVPRPPDLEYVYVFENTATVNRRLVQGGVRLAGRLNSILR